MIQLTKDQMFKAFDYTCTFEASAFDQTFRPKIFHTETGRVSYLGQGGFKESGDAIAYAKQVLMGQREGFWY